jgi:acetate kinase
MRVLVVDAGSHSLRLVVVVEGRRERAAATESVPGSPEAHALLERFLDDVGDVDAVGYRVVHGGPHITEATRLDDQVLDDLREVAPLAPLHVPPAIDAAAALRRRLPDVPHVVAVDTAFHARMPEAARTYALPQDWRRRWDLRRYGFHGLSYASALPRAARLLGREVHELHLVLTHLGGGSSVCAVREGESQWTSMGATPLEGLAMATRSGSVDPGLVLDLLERRGLSLDELRDGLEHRSGLLGLSGERSPDTRELVAAAAEGDGPARLALDVFALRARQGIAAAAACLDRVDAVVFTGEIGADQPELREEICRGLGVLGVASGLTPVVNHDAVVSQPGATVPILVLNVEEDLEVAAETVRVLQAP